MIKNFALAILICIVFHGCGDRVDQPQDMSPEEIDRLIGDALKDKTIVGDSNDSAVENMTLLQTLEFWKDGDDFKYCKLEGLKPLSEVRSLSAVRSEMLDKRFDHPDAETYVTNIMEYASSTDDEVSAHEQEKNTMYLLDKAARKGSAIAMNEIGASLLYCFQHVEQDIGRAEHWLRKAYDAEDYYAAHALAKMYLSGMIVDENPEKKALQLFRFCAGTDHPECNSDFKQLRAETRNK